jgi:hypothetical protein
MRTKVINKITDTTGTFVELAFDRPLLYLFFPEHLSSGDGVDIAVFFYP